MGSTKQRQHTADNQLVADLFGEVADLLELEGGNPFRVRAYRNAARVVQNLPGTVAGLDAEELSHLAGIGKDLAAKIAQVTSTGDLPLLRELRRHAPSGLRDLLLLPGLGPRRAQQLHEQLHVGGLGDLKAAAEAHRIRELPGFGEKTEARILAALGESMPSGGPRRVLLAEAQAYARALLAHLRAVPAIQRLDVAGSYRRRRETVGDLDVLVSCGRPRQIMDRLASFGPVAEVLWRGETKMSVRLRNGLQLDLRVVPDRSYGSALQYFTGSKAHNIELRRRAQAMGLKLSEYGVFSGKRQIAGRNEEDVYAALGLPWIPPELREARGEVEQALAGALPDLVAADDLRGDLHMHTTATDGRDSLLDMVRAAKRRGYSYVAITDHSQRVTVAHGLDARRLKEHWRTIDRVQDQVKGITVLKGVEVDVLDDGSLDLPDRVLAGADWVLAALHYGLRQPQERIMKRLLRAIGNPLVSAIAHPSGRLIGKRAPMALDFPALLKAAADHGCLLEVDGQPERLDLDDTSLIAAREQGVPVVIDSDAHAVGQLDFIELGIGQARRAGLAAKDVANTRTLAGLRRLLRR